VDFLATFEHVGGDSLTLRTELGRADIDDDDLGHGFVEVSTSGDALVVRVVVDDRAEQWRLDFAKICSVAVRAARMTPKAPG
jgi:hypothetical protein